MSTRTTTKQKPKAQRGFSMMQLLVTLAVVSIVSGLAVFGIASARQRIRLTNSSRLLASYVEKARVDSVRRHPIDPAMMSGIEVLNRTTYRVKMDFDGDGVMETRDITLDDGVIFASDPIALVFDWRGRLVDLPTTDIKISIVMQWGDDVNDQRWVDVTRSGDVTIDSDVYLDDIPNPDALGARDGVDGGQFQNANNNPNPSPTPTPVEERSPTPSPSPTPEIADPNPTPTPDGDPTPTPDATPTPAPSPTPSPSASPANNPSPTPTPCTVVVSTSPNPLEFSKRTSGFVSFTVNPSGSVVFKSAPNNLEVTQLSGNTFQITSLNNARGTFTVVFDTPCGTQNVSVTVVN